MRKIYLVISVIIVVLLVSLLPIVSSAEKAEFVHNQKKRKTKITRIDIDQRINRFKYDSGLKFTYPDAVRGIYVTGPSAGGKRFSQLVDLVDTTDLNAMVIDIKEDFGNLTFKPEQDSPYADTANGYIGDPRKMLEVLEAKQIYPIARVVVFKDSALANKRPDLSFVDNGKVWVNNRGEAFVNPFMKEVWDYNIEVAKIAAKLGFKEIQFDYVRFPEGFETREDTLQYSFGAYANSELDHGGRRIEAVTDFVAYAKKELAAYDVEISVDIFGYAATIPESTGIGQNFSRISENVDVISSMIYPSHWTGNFGIAMPDKEPYRLVTEYAKVENTVLDKLKNRPVSRPWIQDFEAPWIYKGTPVTKYGKAEVEGQIKGLNENGIKEYLIWNAGNSYTKNVDYTP